MTINSDVLDKIESTWRDGEPDTVDESRFTPWAEPGWGAWNGSSPELQFCTAVQRIIELNNPDIVVETGVGQGFVTRRVLEVLDGLYFRYESNDKIRSVISKYDNIEPHPTPPPSMIEHAGLVLLDSTYRYRVKEIRLWHKHGNPRSLMFMHDAGNGHKPTTWHSRKYQLVQHLGIHGIKYANPRGSFLGWHETPHNLSELKDIMPIQEIR